MALVLGKDGKQRAVEANAGLPVDVPDLYFGLLTTFPAGADSMTLAELVTGREPTPSAFWYTNGRLPITFSGYGAFTPLVCTSSNAGGWTNTTGATQYVRGLFIATVDYPDTDGEILWVGRPDVGDIPVYHNATTPRGVSWDLGLVDLAVNYVGTL